MARLLSGIYCQTEDETRLIKVKSLGLSDVDICYLPPEEDLHCMGGGY